MTEYFAEKGRSNISGFIKEFPIDAETGSPDLSAVVATRAGIYDAEQDAWLTTIYSLPTDRKSGNGTELEKDFVEECRRYNARRIVGYFSPSPDADEEVVQAWYEKRGYQVLDLGKRGFFVVKELS